MSEGNALNPNHPVTQAMSQQWHKICAVMMCVADVDHMVITPLDIQKFQASDRRAIAMEEKKDGMHIRLLTMEEAQELARREGGLPT